MPRQEAETRPVPGKFTQPQGAEKDNPLENTNG